MNQPGFFTAMVLLALGAYGWGRALILGLDRCATSTVRIGDRDEMSGPMVLTIGIGIVLAISGVAVAGNLATFGFIVGLLGLGSVFSLAFAFVRFRAHPRRPALRTIGVGAGFVVVAFVAYGTALTGPINPNDDDPGYLYLAYRLLATGGLIDPFNFRRITSFGGGEVFEALTIHLSGSVAALGFEWFFCVVLVTALVLGRASRPLGAPVALVVGVALSVAHPVGAWANSAPSFSGVALTLALFLLLRSRLRGGRDWRTDVCIGVLASGLLALRYEFVIPAAIAIVISTVVHFRAKVVSVLLVTGGTALVAIVGWSVALDRSSGTPLFPVVAGNYNTAFPWEDPAFRTTRQFVSRVSAEIGTDSWGWTVVGALVACAVLFVLGRRWVAAGETTPVILVGVGAAAGCAVLLLVETRPLSGGVLADVGRYDAPSTLALALFLFSALWSASEQVTAVAGASGDPALGSWKVRLGRGICGSMAAVLIALSVETYFPTIPPYGSPFRDATVVTWDDSKYAWLRLTGWFGNKDRLADAMPRYAKINAAIPKGANVLSAVSIPGLLDFAKFRFATLDIPEAVSPPPGIPVTQGAPAVVSYLKHLGYTGIVASVTAAPGLYRYKPWRENETSGIEVYRAMGLVFTGWAHDLVTLVHVPGVHRVRFGSLEYFSWTNSGSTP